MRLMIHSKSTEQYVDDWKHDETMMISSHPTRETLENANSQTQVIAIGGGSVIDTAKIVSRNRVIAIPTTFAGASRTSHAVYWHEEQKFNFDTKQPITILKPEYLETLPENFYQYSKADCICHAVESLISTNSTEESRFYALTALELIQKGKREDALIGSLLAADAFEITGTNLLHALSYPLTAIYGVPHGKALLFLLPRVLPYIQDLLEPNIQIKERTDLDVNMMTIVDEALRYPKIFETRKLINRKVLMEMFQ